MRCLGAPLFLLFLWRPFVWAALADSSYSIPVPQNLTIESFNFQNKLRWAAVNNASVSYTVQYRVEPSNTWKQQVNCVNIKKPECDFVFEDYAIITLRVRAQQGELKSNWTMTSSFQLQSYTTLGPPKNINISAMAESLIISFDHPFKYTAPSTFFEYVIYYWDNATKTNRTTQTSQKLYSLKNLKQRTVYCIQIQIQMKIPFRSNLKGLLSAPYCKETTVTDATKKLQMALIFGFIVFILISVFLSLWAVWKYKDAIKSLWRPPLTIPYHFEEALGNSQIITVEFKDSPGEEHWDTLSVVSNAEVNCGLAEDNQQ